MGIGNEDISIAISNEQMAWTQGSLGHDASALSHYERSVEAYRRLGDVAKVAQIQPRIAGLRARMAARAA